MKHSSTSIKPTRVTTNALALAAGIETPPEQDWLFMAAHAPPDYQLYAWLEYEYGRSSRFLREQVEVARKCQPPAREVGEYADLVPSCPFACRLARHAPEFPDQAWNSLAPARRDELLTELGLDRWDKVGGERVLKELDLDRIRDECARGEPFEDLFRSSSERYVAFRLNLGWSQKQIREAFGRWLRLACEPAPGRPTVKTGHLAHRTKGKGLNKTAVLPWMNRLVALRWGKHFSETWEECEKRIRDKKLKKPIGYQNESSWINAQFDAANLLQRLEFAWAKHWVGAVHEILDPRRFTHRPGCRLLASKLPWSKSRVGRRAENKHAPATAALREYIRHQVQGCQAVA